MARPHTTAGAPQELGLQDDVASPLLSPTSQNDGSGHSSPCVVSETTVARSCGPTHKSPVRGPAFNSALFLPHRMCCHLHLFTPPRAAASASPKSKELELPLRPHTTGGQLEGNEQGAKKPADAKQPTLEDLGILSVVFHSCCCMYV